MTIAFDFDQVRTVEFGIGRDGKTTRTFCSMPIDKEVGGALQEMAKTTSAELVKQTKTPPGYEPSEKHENVEYLILPLNDDLADSLRGLYQASNLPSDAHALDDPTRIFCYFARFTDKQGRHLTGLRRAVKFKGVLKNRLVHLVTDALKLIEDKVFKLDTNFDLLIDKDHIHILHPAAFEFAGQLQQAVMGAVPDNIALLRKDLSFVDFGVIEKYACHHPRAARYLASIRTGKGTRNVNKARLIACCKQSSVKVEDKSGKLCVEDQHIMGFLEVLDRRRYEVELVAGKPEQFRALSRRRLRRDVGKTK